MILQKTSHGGSSMDVKTCKYSGSFFQHQTSYPRSADRSIFDIFWEQIHGIRYYSSTTTTTKKNTSYLPVNEFTNEFTCSSSHCIPLGSFDVYM